MSAPPSATAATFSRRIRASGLVQGVGFRPYVWRLARETGLAGWVRNDASGVDILVEGSREAIEAFTARLPTETPQLAELARLDWQDGPAGHAGAGFDILESGRGQVITRIGQDTGLCPECLAELFDPDGRRWRHAFITCTHCGPRYTLARGLPWDRTRTSMAGFPLCPDCEREYTEPSNRRFHAEPVCCPRCGPRLELRDAAGRPLMEDDPVAATLALLESGGIVAIKGLGGFHLACDARNGPAVARLRQRKDREQKPFAIMAANPLSLAGLAQIGPGEATLLTSPERPIVLLRKQAGTDRALPGIAPGLAWLGALLPYAPLHWLLFHEAVGRPAGTGWTEAACQLLLVMTSANPGGQPLVTDNDEALERLAGIADAYLLHDRDIVVRCDDSVVRVSGEWRVETGETRDEGRDLARRLVPGGARAEDAGGFHFIRRARGFVPRPIALAQDGPPVLALGGYLKNTVCVTRGREAFVSQHIGSLSDTATCAMLEEVAQHLLAILEVKPQALAHDLHPDAFSSQHALELAEAWGVPAIAVQHHHAHLAAVAAEHGLEAPFLGLALDGVGLGTDGTAWGGELLKLDGAHCERLGHLAPLPLPGGDRAAREPWRMAAAVLHRLGRGEEISLRFPRQAAAARLDRILESGLNCPPTSSLGRVFDAAAGLLGLFETMAFEGQAAMGLEGLADSVPQALPMEGGYRFEDGVLDLLPLLERLANGMEAAEGAALFHATLAAALADWVLPAVHRTGLSTVALSGGCLLNRILAIDLRRRLEAAGLSVLEARLLPPNDGGLSLGQAWVAMQTLQNRKKNEIR